MDGLRNTNRLQPNANIALGNQRWFKQSGSSHLHRKTNSESEKAKDTAQANIGKARNLQNKELTDSQILKGFEMGFKRHVTSRGLDAGMDLKELEKLMPQIMTRDESLKLMLSAPAVTEQLLTLTPDQISKMPRNIIRNLPDVVIDEKFPEGIPEKLLKDGDVDLIAGYVPKEHIAVVDPAGVRKLSNVNEEHYGIHEAEHVFEAVLRTVMLTDEEVIEEIINTVVDATKNGSPLISNNVILPTAELRNKEGEFLRELLENIDNGDYRLEKKVDQINGVAVEQTVLTDEGINELIERYSKAEGYETLLNRFENDLEEMKAVLRESIDSELLGYEILSGRNPLSEQFNLKCRIPDDKVNIDEGTADRLFKFEEAKVEAKKAAKESVRNFLFTIKGNMEIQSSAHRSSYINYAFCPEEIAAELSAIKASVTKDGVTDEEINRNRKLVEIYEAGNEYMSLMQRLQVAEQDEVIVQKICKLASSNKKVKKIEEEYISKMEPEVYSKEGSSEELDEIIRVHKKMSGDSKSSSIKVQHSLDKDRVKVLNYIEEISNREGLGINLTELKEIVSRKNIIHQERRNLDKELSEKDLYLIENRLKDTPENERLIREIKETETKLADLLNETPVDGLAQKLFIRVIGKNSLVLPPKSMYI